jgi:vacuolar-type H+-ATPase subunit E/Vma4
MSILSLMNTLPRTKSEFRQVVDSVQSEISRLQNQGQTAAKTFNNYDERTRLYGEARIIQEAFNGYDDRVRGIFNSLPN